MGKAASHMIRAAALGLAAASLGAVAHAQQEGRPLTATLSGANEKPTPGDPGATGTASLRVDPGKSQVCYELQVKNLAQPTMAHIHKGGPNDAGPVALALSPPDASGKSQACVTADAALAKDLVQNPGAYYVNVHSAQFKAGAIRGQLSK